MKFYFLLGFLIASNLYSAETELTCDEANKIVNAGIDLGQASGTCDAISIQVEKGDKINRAIEKVKECEKQKYVDRCYRGDIRGDFLETYETYTICVYMDNSAGVSFIDTEVTDGVPPYTPGGYNGCGANDAGHTGSVPGIYCATKESMDEGISGGDKLNAMDRKIEKGKLDKAKKKAKKAAAQYKKWVERDRRSIGGKDIRDRATNWGVTNQCRTYCVLINTRAKQLTDNKAVLDSLKEQMDVLCAPGGAGVPDPDEIAKRPPKDTFMKGSGDGSGDGSSGDESLLGGGSDSGGLDSGSLGAATAGSVAGAAKKEAKAKEKASKEGLASRLGYGGVAYPSFGGSSGSSNESGSSAVSPYKDTTQKKRTPDIASKDSDDIFREISKTYDARAKAEIIGEPTLSEGDTKKMQRIQRGT